YAVRAEDDGGAVGHLGELVHEHRAARAQAVDHETVVHDFVAHVDRRTERFQRALDDLDGAVDTGTKAAGIGEQDFHAAIIAQDAFASHTFFSRHSRESARRSSTAELVIHFRS